MAAALWTPNQGAAAIGTWCLALVQLQDLVTGDAADEDPVTHLQGGGGVTETGDFTRGDDVHGEGLRVEGENVVTFFRLEITELITDEGLEGVDDLTGHQQVAILGVTEVVGHDLHGDGVEDLTGGAVELHQFAATPGGDV